MQIYYLSSTNIDGTDSDCENLGWKRLQEYDPAQRRWKYLSDLAGAVSMQEESSSFEEEDVLDEDYYPSLPFAALFSCCKGAHESCWTEEPCRTRRNRAETVPVPRSTVQAKGLKVTCIFSYCSEGDNIPDSFLLAEASCKLLGKNPYKSNGDGDNGWVIPYSMEDNVWASTRYVTLLIWRS